ncbi:hypothetical protein [Kingella oralis]|uniref:Uncharacterized protein n=1 Tax=Kingella oralis ATCC 51147 TaxID=629741 RepID=C4GIQ1_9NEIS|nr:hypothetical protein [Kingella oralis]EEP67672.1 hypothetical protein GCWU000324_01921 [Kingella oralis ATCC 51147]
MGNEWAWFPSRTIGSLKIGLAFQAAARFNKIIKIDFRLPHPRLGSLKT